MKLGTGTILPDYQYSFALSVNMCWSKNIQSEHQPPTQIVLASMNPIICPLWNVVIYMECIGTKDGHIFQCSNKNASNHLDKIFESGSFTKRRAGLLGTHNIRKGSATYAGCCGITKEWISTRGHWQGNR